mmetsp:Transcript_19074/g.39977  ORF Transcript_19074/g.39977 Transcript_19074/m.39977 type:complete len:496 (+) Transcript_19074:352-1839(+)
MNQQHQQPPQHHASRPPLDPPPFGPAAVRQCIKTQVRIQNNPSVNANSPASSTSSCQLQEVLILTSLVKSVDEILREKEQEDARVRALKEGSGGDGNNDDGGMSVDKDEEEDDIISDFSESSTSSSEESSEEEEYEQGNHPNNSKLQHVSMEKNNDEYDDSRDSSSSDYNSSEDEECKNDCQNMNGVVENHCELRHSQSGGSTSDNRMKAFLLRKEPMCENRHGIFTSYIYYAKVLYKADLYWMASNEEVAIKAVSWKCIRSCANKISEDFIKEVAALQYLSEWHATQNSTIRESHVMTPDIVMSNESHLFIVMPFCRGGDLCMRVAEVERFTEDVARFYFRQILKGLETLQKAHICHRDLSPENFMILDEKCIVIDFGMSLRVPYSAGQRYLIKEQYPCGKLPHMSPEIFKQMPFDGHAVDVWSVATVLLFMLTGKRLASPPTIDRPFDQMDLGLSYDAMDLLRRMFRLDPKDRLSLEDIMNHSWVRNEFLSQR